MPERCRVIAVAALALSLLPGRAAALCGDADADGRVVATDARAALLLAVSAGYDARLDLRAGGAHDGVITATDALGVLQAAVSRALLSCAAFTATRAAVFTASNSFASGSIAEVALADRSVTLQNTVLAGDTVARVQAGRLFALNRFGSNNIQELNAAYATVKQCGLGAATNPVDFVIASATKGYVSQFDSTSIAIVNPSVASNCSGFVTGAIDLSAWADADGTPEMNQMALVGGRLFVALQLLDRRDLFRPSGPGLLLTIDTTTDTVIDSLTLAFANPFSETKGIAREPGTGRLLLGGPGLFFQDLEDGGIEAVDASTGVSSGIVISGTTLDADLTDFALLGTARGYAILADAAGTHSLVEFRTGPSASIIDVLATSDESFSDLEINERGELWLCDRSFVGGDTPGVRVFSTADNSELTAEPLDVGSLPFNVVFLD